MKEVYRSVTKIKKMRGIRKDIFHFQEKNKNLSAA